MMTKIVALLVLCALITSSSLSQGIQSNSDRERNFAFEVKQIDEFFERFNNEETAFLPAYLKSQMPGVIVDRLSLLKSLFNEQNKALSDTARQSFIREVNDSLQPLLLDFNKTDWYAETSCRFMYHGRPVDVSIILRILQVDGGGAKWVITRVKPAFPLPSGAPKPFLTEREPHKFLNPISHATNFIGLSVALKDKKNILDYFDPQFMHKPLSGEFLNALLRDELHYLYVRSIRYHFLQLDGWKFTVDHFSRPGVNSGWLINRLNRISATEKADYLLSW